MLALIVEALREAGLAGFQLRIGDLGLFTALLDALAMPQRWRRRLRHQFWRPDAFRAELARLTSRDALQAHGISARADGGSRSRPAAATRRALRRSLSGAAGLELIGTRTLAEIAERLLAEAADARETPLAPETAALIESYIASRRPPARRPAGSRR